LIAIGVMYRDQETQRITNPSLQWEKAVINQCTCILCI